MVNKLDLAGVGMTSQRTRSRLVSRLRDQGIKDELVLDIISSTPRHVFIDEALSHRAYEDNALPIGFNQTISQPYIVALMTALLRVDKTSKVLEVGTGSGYQTAILAELVDKIYSVEIIPALVEIAAPRLKRLGYNNAHVIVRNGYEGWEEQAPFDSIIVTAAAKEIPQALLEQLKVGGHIVIPVESDIPYSGQQFLVGQKHDNHEVSFSNALPVIFVPLVKNPVYD